ncbi:MAG: hypothetical protein KC445_11900 [Anaerolineales bacterium]|nr:hypothetical protein [Anaerolineales bacterium]
MLTKPLHKIAAVILLILLIAACLAASLFQPPRALAYEAVQTFPVGSFSATLETQTYSLVHGDNGVAKIIVVAGGEQTVLDTWFDNDLFNDIRPGYVSWQNVDDHWRRDLVIWLPTYDGNLLASAYVSSEDGRLHPLDPPLQRQRLFD